MGITHSQRQAGEKKQSLRLKVATLNYSGILLSPYEFYEEIQDKNTSEMNENMKKILKRQCLVPEEDLQLQFLFSIKIKEPQKWIQEKSKQIQLLFQGENQKNKKQLMANKMKQEKIKQLDKLTLPDHITNNKKLDEKQIQIFRHNRSHFYQQKFFNAKIQQVKEQFNKKLKGQIEKLKNQGRNIEQLKGQFIKQLIDKKKIEIKKNLIDRQMDETYSKQFMQFLDEKIKGISFNIGELDKNWQKGRFSPVYEPQCGVKKGSLNMMSKKEFQSEWDKCEIKNSQFLKKIYDHYSHKLGKKGKKVEQQKDLLENCKKFDCMLYEAILKTVYKQNQEKKELLKFDSDTFNLQAKKYKDHRKAKFSKSFLKQELKIKTAIQMIQKLKIDILFVQEASKEFIQAIQRHLQGFLVCKASKDSICKSAIIIRLQKFPKVQSLVIENSRFLNNITNLKQTSSRQRKRLKDLKQDLNFNQDTVIQFIYNIILICPHLTSNQSEKQEERKKKQQEQSKGIKRKKAEGKKPKGKKDEGQDNQIQTQLLNNAIIRLRRAFPQCHIIVGGDLNNEWYQPQELDSQNKDVQNTQANINGKDQPRNGEVPEEKISLKDNFFANKDKCQFYSFPELKSKLITSYKKRTYLQAQPKKAGEVISSKKDYIITSLKIVQNSKKIIYFTNGQNPQQCEENQELLSFFPTNNHPYDHFLVYVEVKVQEKLEHVTDIEYLSKYEPGRLSSRNYSDLVLNKKKVN